MAMLVLMLLIGFAMVAWVFGWDVELMIEDR
jgi:hypothetical protein